MADVKQQILDDVKAARAEVIGLIERMGPGQIDRPSGNEGWSVKDAPDNIRRLDKYRLDGVETPVKRDNPADIAAVRREVKVPILEHVNDLAYAMALAKAGAVDVFNISCPGAGGIFPARQIAAVAEAARSAS